MKDILIPAKRIKKELIILLVCFSAAFLLNIYAIAKYAGGWSELLGQLHIVVILSLAIYFIVAILRLILFGILKGFKKGSISGKGFS
ncbi:hypothetical protein MNBD_BACTEROID01-2449 [hydrothermal vent metagenome]|uniref:Uncharacterized protein n=1 Tax=hydrothermal vent metagenome TaxID=652676 RepID=A0A3B0TUF4_9ZZZZ